MTLSRYEQWRTCWQEQPHWWTSLISKPWHGGGKGGGWVSTISFIPNCCWLGQLHFGTVLNLLRALFNVPRLKVVQNNSLHKHDSETCAMIQYFLKLYSDSVWPHEFPPQDNCCFLTFDPSCKRGSPRISFRSSFTSLSAHFDTNRQQTTCNKLLTHALIPLTLTTH